MPTMKERRKHRRYTIAYPVETKNGSRLEMLTLVDVSKGGVAFTSSKKPEENERLDLKLFLKNRMFTIKAIVVHAKRLKENIYNIGVQFLHIPKEFHASFDEEVEEITQFHRECNLYNHKSLSFEKASTEYLKNTPPSEA